MGFVVGSIGHQNLLAGYGLTTADPRLVDVVDLGRRSEHQYDWRQSTGFRQGEHLGQFTDVPHPDNDTDISGLTFLSGSQKTRRSLQVQAPTLSHSEIRCTPDRESRHLGAGPCQRADDDRPNGGGRNTPSFVERSESLGSRAVQKALPELQKTTRARLV
jgi:hypothetical protein